MKETKNLRTTIILAFGIILLQGCMADLRTPLIKEQGIVDHQEKKGREILAKAWRKQGMDKLANYGVYSFHGSDIWKGLMGRLGKPWPEAKSQIEFKYVVGTFDGQVYFKNGKPEGLTAGLQSYQYYEQPPGEELKFQPFDEKIAFGLSAYQYLMELLDRLKKVPIISYAGEKTFNGNEYDLVFATWQQAEPHLEHDQYVLWINRETELLDYAVYTLRETYLKMPGSRAFYGSIKLSDYQEVDGVLIPHRQTVFLNKPNKKEKNHLHQMIVSEFAFDNFDMEELYPDPNLERLGDRKK